MLVASLKRKENIAEYLLYMWQIEDLIRANSLDLGLIEERIINESPLSDEDLKRVTGWYESLIDMMRSEGIEKSGHLQLTRNVLDDMVTLHQQLLANPKYDNYHKLYYQALPLIVELRAKAGEHAVGEIETCLNALYGTLIMRLRGQDLTDSTRQAISTISKFIGTLSAYYKLEEEGKLLENKE